MMSIRVALGITLKRMLHKDYLLFPYFQLFSGEINPGPFYFTTKNLCYLKLQNCKKEKKLQHTYIHSLVTSLFHFSNLNCKMKDRI